MKFDFYSVPFGSASPKTFLFSIDIDNSTQVISAEDTIEKIFFCLLTSEFQIRFHDIIMFTETCDCLVFKHLKLTKGGYYVRRWQ